MSESLVRELLKLENRIETHERVCEQIRRTEQDYRKNTSEDLQEIRMNIDKLESATEKAIAGMNAAFDTKISKINDKLMFAVMSALGSSVALSVWLFAHIMHWV
jgi:hypothetical protein